MFSEFNIFTSHQRRFHLTIISDLIVLLYSIENTEAWDLFVQKNKPKICRVNMYKKIILYVQFCERKYYMFYWNKLKQQNGKPIENHKRS